MRATTTWLSDAEKRSIVDGALDLLANVGMRFAGSRTLPLLAERGARIDEATGIVRLPRDLVAWAVERCPRSFLMAGASPADDVMLGEGRPFHFRPAAVSPRPSTTARAPEGPARWPTCARARRSWTRCRSSTSCGRR